jgi:hypothetical protein
MENEIIAAEVTVAEINEIIASDITVVEIITAEIIMKFASFYDS